MIDPEVKLDNIKKKMKFKLEMPNNDGLVHFYLDDLKDLKISGRELRESLWILKKRNIIESIEESDEDGLFELADGTVAHISEYPDEHPGIFIIKPTEEFIKEGINEIGNNKIKIYIDKKHGIYLNEATRKPSYGIDTSSGRFKIIKALKNQKILRGDKLYEIMQGKNCPAIEANNKAERGKRAAIVSNAVTKINELIRENLEINKIFIINFGSSGYTINTDEFNPKYR